jgi:hypothetical protein
MYETDSRSYRMADWSFEFYYQRDSYMENNYGCYLSISSLRGMENIRKTCFKHNHDFFFRFIAHFSVTGEQQGDSSVQRQSRLHFHISLCSVPATCLEVNIRLRNVFPSSIRTPKKMEQVARTLNVFWLVLPSKMWRKKRKSAPYMENTFIHWKEEFLSNFHWTVNLYIRLLN